MPRIGVFVCHCGINIASIVDVEKVRDALAKHPGVAYSVDYRYMCSDPGQKMIQDAIREHKLTGVVVAACSPQMHEVTFRSACAVAGLNPYLCEMANIREHCSWVHTDKEAATQKAIELVRMMVEKVKRNQELQPIYIEVTKRALVIGGGVAGIQAALDIADAGYEVILVEREPSIGGHMAQLSETFPTLDCSQCILTPKMVQVRKHPNIKLYTYSEIEEVQGYIGNFEVTIRKRARSVREDLCTGCGICQQRCPARRDNILSEFDRGLTTRPAIYVPFPQAVPNVPVIDREHCRYFLTGKCRVCERVCPANAIDYEQQDELITEKVGAIIVATGYELISPQLYGEYGGGRFMDVIDGLQFERLLSASGPTGGKVLRPSDGKEAKVVVFIACVGSRDRAKGIPYCSKICCMYIAKHTILFKHRVHDGECYVFYMDIRAGGKGYDEFVRRAIEEEGACYLRGRVSRIYEKNDKLVVMGMDTLSGKLVEVEADLVVLATAMRPADGWEELARKLRLSYDAFGFYAEAHPKLRPVETNTAGIFLAGACQAPKDIPDAVAQASGAASKVLSLFGRDEFEREPLIAEVNEQTCVGCFDCERVCPYGAIERKEIRDRRGNLIKVVSSVNPGICEGCGACVSACRNGSIDLRGFNDEQVFAQLSAIATPV